MRAASSRPSANRVPRLDGLPRRQSAREPPKSQVRGAVRLSFNAQHDQLGASARVHARMRARVCSIVRLCRRRSAVTVRNRSGRRVVVDSLAVDKTEDRAEPIRSNAGSSRSAVAMRSVRRPRKPRLNCLSRDDKQHGRDVRLDRTRAETNRRGGPPAAGSDKIELRAAYTMTADLTTLPPAAAVKSGAI